MADTDIIERYNKFALNANLPAWPSLSWNLREAILEGRAFDEGLIADILLDKLVMYMIGTVPMEVLRALARLEPSMSVEDLLRRAGADAILLDAVRIRDIELAPAPPTREELLEGASDALSKGRLDSALWSVIELLRGED